MLAGAKSIAVAIGGPLEKRPAVYHRAVPAWRLNDGLTTVHNEKPSFAAAIKHLPRIRLTIRQRTQVLERWPKVTRQLQMP